jgi:hypothetical protein
MRHPDDAHGMNWVVDAAENPWHTRAHDWGLGYCRLPEAPLWRWEEPAGMKVTEEFVGVRYNGPGVTVLVTREFDELGRLTESYTFRNETDAELPVSDIGIYTPFNDNYPNADVCLPRRCNAHLWCGGHSAYAACLRMGGEAPHLGMVLTAGSVSAYSIQGREDQYMYSQVRGDIILHPANLLLPPKGSATIGWTLFWHGGWDDFFLAARAFPGFMQVALKSYTLFPGETLSVTADGGAEMLLNGEPVTTERHGTRLSLRQPVTEPGEVTITVRDSERETWARALVTLDPLELVRRRVRFIVERQQVTDPDDPRCGAFLVYDRENGGLWRGEWPWDHNEARERVGMGVLLAQYLQREHDPVIDAAARRYAAFVRAKLQDDQYRVYSSYLKNEDPARLRMYNFPWVAQLYLEMYRYTGETTYLQDFYATMKAFYAQGGHKFYAIDIPVLAGITTLEAAGMREERDSLLADYRRQAARFMENGVHYPIHEVNYEQTIVAPAASVLIEMYLVTKETQYLEAVEPHLRCLEAFNGRQPDFHLHDIAIRHWDGYWFGKYRVWGDTFPHYWSSVTGVVFHRYAEATLDVGYEKRAQTILRNNLCLFHHDGWASCAYLYPKTIEGRWGGYYDPNANDQDWALVHYLMVNP